MLSSFDCANNLRKGHIQIQISCQYLMGKGHWALYHIDFREGMSPAVDWERNLYIWAKSIRQIGIFLCSYLFFDLSWLVSTNIKRQVFVKSWYAKKKQQKMDWLFNISVHWMKITFWYPSIFNGPFYDVIYIYIYIYIDTSVIRKLFCKTFFALKS